MAAPTVGMTARPRFLGTVPEHLGLLLRHSMSYVSHGPVKSGQGNA